MNRSLQMLIAVCVVVGAGLGYGIATTPAHAAPTATSQRLAVRSATDVCQDVVGDADISTTVTAYSPSGIAGAPSSGSASLRPVAGGSSLFGTPKPGVPKVETRSSGPNSLGSAYVGQADGGLAPGFSLGETISATSGPDAGLSGTACQGPGTQFWFVGASGSVSRNSYLYLSDSDASVAEFNVTLYGAQGPIEAVGAAGQPLAPGKTQAFLLSSLLGPTTTTPVLAVHVSVVEGRISAGLLDMESGATSTSGSDGADFVPQASGSGEHLVIPGIPTDPSGSVAQKVQLYLLDPGATDVSVNLHWIGDSTIVPAQNSQITAHAGKVTTVDLSGTETAGEAAALRLDASGPVIAGIRVSRSSDSTNKDFAFGGPASPITGDGIITDNRTGSGWQSQFLLTAPGATATARITTIGTAGSPRTVQVTVPGGTTKAVPLTQPGGSAGDPYTAVLTWSGGGPLYGARVLTDSSDGPAFTVQELGDAVERVTVPTVRNDLSGLVRQP